MKTLIAIWATVVITAIGTFAYVNAEINKLVIEKSIHSLQETMPGSKLQPAAGLKVETYNPQQTINGNTLQGGQ